MTYTYHYDSPLGGITLSSNGTELTGLWFDGQKYFGDTLPKEYEEKPLPIFEQSVHWLDIYFSHKPFVYVCGYLGRCISKSEPSR